MRAKKLNIPSAADIEDLDGNSLGIVVTEDMQAALTAKQDTLVSGTNIKTINGSSVLGSGDLTISGGSGDVAGSTVAATAKTTPVDADLLPIVDSAASNVLKKLTWANLKATLKTYFDTLYVSLSGALGTPSSGTLTNCTGLPTAGMVDASVTLAKMANLAQDQFIGRTTASTGVPQTATITAAARTVLDDTTVAAMVDTLGGASSTGTGGIARATSPTFVTPTLGAASATSLVATNIVRVTETVSTPSGTTQTITLDNGNHQTLSLASTTGNPTITLTVPTSSAAGTLILIQHGTTPRSITWAVSSGTIVWAGGAPTFSGDAVSTSRVISWRWNGSVMRLAATEVFS